MGQTLLNEYLWKWLFGEDKVAEKEYFLPMALDWLFFMSMFVKVAQAALFLLFHAHDLIG